MTSITLTRTRAARAQSHWGQLAAAIIDRIFFETRHDTSDLPGDADCVDPIP